MSSKYQITSNGHVSTENSEQIYREIEKERDAIKRSIEDLKNSFDTIKANGLDVIQNPASAIKRNINIDPSKIITERPFKALLITAGLGYVVARMLTRSQIPDRNYNRLNGLSRLNQDNLSPSITDEIVDRLKQELSNTASLVIQEVFQTLRSKMQKYNSNEK